MENPAMTAVGKNGQIELYSTYLVIKRKGFMAFATQGFKGDKQIFLDQVTAVQLRKPGLLTAGYIQFAFPGSQESKAALASAPSDENTVMIDPKQYPAFEQLKAGIEARIQEIRSGSANASGSSGADEVAKLAELHDRGVLSDDEFAAAKRRILGI